jgi:hypothetical protein
MAPERSEGDVKWPAPAFAAALTTATACGSSATGPGYQGQPLFTISGQMATLGEAPPRPIRLAVAWYADHTTLGGPQAIVTQDVQYQGSFPLDYTFSFYGPPPDSALNVTTVAGATFRASWGVLIAYEDLNGNGQLDTIPAGGSPIDHILATSIGNLFNGQPAAHPVRVAYIDGAPPTALQGYVAGYNLYQEQNAALPANTAVGLSLGGEGASELDLFVCPDFVTGAYLASPNSAAHSSFDLPCNIPPSGGVRVAGTLMLADGVPTIWIRVTDGVNQLPQATVTVNGVPLTYSEFDGVFEGTGSGFAVEDAGEDVLSVTLPDDDGGRQFVLTKPPDFSIEAPSPNVEPRFLAGAPIEVDWTSAVPGASIYTVSLISTQKPYGDDLQQTVTAPSGATQQLVLIAPNIDGPELLTVFGATSDQPVFGEGGSVLVAGTYRSAYIDLASSDAGLAAFGGLTVIHDPQGHGHSEALVEPYEGSVPISGGASVTVDGQALAWSDANGGFYSRSVVFDAGCVCDTEVTVPGLSPFQVAVQVPGDFAVNAAPSKVVAGQVLELSWSPSAGATGYNVLVWVSDGGNQVILNEVSTLDNSVSMVVPRQVGLMYVTVVALGTEADRHFSGVAEEQWQIFVSSE